MAFKTIYQPRIDCIGVTRTLIEYEYFSGFALSQKQKSINSLHNAAEKKGISKILEISTKSPFDLGTKLSAFNLMLTRNGIKFSVEQIFQASKVFEQGGPYLDLYNKTSKEAKTDIRLKDSGKIVSFNFLNSDFPTQPYTYFYDWLYSNALLENKPYLEKALEFNAFSDIEFNEKKSINCQAYSLALFCSIIHNKKEILDKETISKEEFLELCKEEYELRWNLNNTLS